MGRVTKKSVSIGIGNADLESVLIKMMTTEVEELDQGLMTSEVLSKECDYRDRD